ncbi:hypothetical protein GPK34_06420 [Secundilactobacillus kimchicus]|uniref:hypothetical protein n=1 Tax=Secundilactobacillus kimchicus TaxID=528209 RepID=UPI001C0249BC|nr:hypothetical protein [Secundilactobacillus kimchicus]MBT9671661.1 hypothetical protein [Secundilactobacillus kimchicus]
MVANRYQLAVIKKKLPERYHSDFCWYIAELALRMQVTQSTNLDQALAEQKQLLRENQVIWTGLYTAKEPVQLVAQDLIGKTAKYHGLTTAVIPQYLEMMNGLLR